jgi:hypothetical protein
MIVLTVVTALGPVRERRLTPLEEGIGWARGFILGWEVHEIKAVAAFN